MKYYENRRRVWKYTKKLSYVVCEGPLEVALWRIETTDDFVDQTTEFWGPNYKWSKCDPNIFF